MAQKITHFENRGSHIQQARSSVSTQFVTRLCSVLDPLCNPLRMAAINSIMPLSSVCAWHEVTLCAQGLEPKDLLENIRRYRHPTFTALREKILFWPIHDADASVANPVHTRIHNLDVSQSNA